MKRLLRRRPSPALVISCGALFVALAPAAYGTHLGALLLGHPNTATNQTSLSASVNAATPGGGKALQLTNTNSGAGATALGLNVAAGKAPFTVNSGTKVTNLNADMLDGLDSTGYVRRCGQGGVLAYAFAHAQPNLDWYPVPRGYTCLGDGIVRYRRGELSSGTYFVDFGYSTSSRSPCPTLIVDGQTLGTVRGSGGELNLRGFSYVGTVAEVAFPRKKCLAKVETWGQADSWAYSYEAFPFVVTLLGY